MSKEVLTEEAKKIRNAYHRSVRAADPDRMRRAQIRYWNKKAKEQAEGNKNK